MAKLPHYKNSKVSMEMYEPLYNSHFELIITPPFAIADWDLIIENINKVSGIETNKMPALVTQKFKGTTRTFAGGAVDDTSITFTIDMECNLNDSNSAFALKGLRLWSDAIYDPLTGKYGIKKEYVGGPAVLSAYNKKMDIYRQWTFPQIFLAEPLPNQEFDYSDNGIFVLSGVKFKADFWEEVIL